MTKKREGSKNEVDEKVREILEKEYLNMNIDFREEKKNEIALQAMTDLVKRISKLIVQERADAYLKAVDDLECIIGKESSFDSFGNQSFKYSTVRRKINDLKKRAKLEWKRS